jgi:hypothetical protein
MTLTMMLAEELIKDRHHEAERRRLASTLKPRQGRNRGWVLRKARPKDGLS